MSARSADDSFLGASGRFLPLAVYDRGLMLTMRERTWRPVLVRAVAAAVPAGGAVAEVGAGTGSLTAGLRAALPAGVTLTAVDPDARALAIAARKLPSADVHLREGSAEALPLADASQDAVVTSLMLHHLTPAAKLAALREAHRVLRPGGRLLVADFGAPQDALTSLAFGVVELIDGRATTRSHRDGIVPRTIAEAGFAAPAQLLRLRTAGGTLELLASETRPSA